MLSKIKIRFNQINRIVSTTTFVFLLVMPASATYKLKDFGFGSGGTGNSTSPQYSLEAISGEISGSGATSPNYKVNSGLIFTNQANVPGAPTFSNPSNYYNKLQVILDTQSNPTDTKYAIAISADNFVTTNFVQSDNTVGSILGSEDYQLYAAWGGAGGFYVIGLTPGTTYKMKVKAMQGRFTETGYGPIATAATVNPTLSFSLNTTTVNFGNLDPSIVNSSPQDYITLDTNSASGASVYITGSNAGLLSTANGHKINAVSAVLSAGTEGFGAQRVSAAQTSGGPLTVAAIYNYTDSTVGITDQNIRTIFDTVAPIVGGNGAFLFKATTATLTPSATDYKEIITMTAAGKF